MTCTDTPTLLASSANNKTVINLKECNNTISTLNLKTGLILTLNEFY